MKTSLAYYEFYYIFLHYYLEKSETTFLSNKLDSMSDQSITTRTLENFF